MLILLTQTGNSSFNENHGAFEGKSCLVSHSMSAEVDPEIMEGVDEMLTAVSRDHDRKSTCSVTTHF